MGRLAWSLAVCVGAGLALPGGASAQERTERRGRHRLGPAWVTVRLQLKNAGVDTNVFQTFADPVRDEVAVLGARGDGVLRIGRRLEISGYGFVEQYHYRREGEERATDFSGGGQADLDLGGLRLFGGGGGGRFTQRFSIDVDERLPRQEKRAFAGAELRLTGRLSVTAQTTAEVVTFSPGTFRLGGDVKEAMDRNSLTASGQLRHALTSRTSLVLSADALEDRFISQPAHLPRVRRSYRYLGGLEFGKSAVVSGKLLVGLRQIPGTLAQGSPPYKGPIGTADLTLPIGRRAHLRFQGLRDVVYAASLVQVGSLRYRNAFVHQRYWGEAFLPLSPKGLATVLSAGFEQARYLLPYPYLGSSRLAERVDHRFTAGAAIVQQIGQTVRIGGHVFWARRVSSLPFFSYEGVRYGLSAELVP